MNKFHFFRVLVCALSLASVTLFVAPPAPLAAQMEKWHADVALHACISAIHTTDDDEMTREIMACKVLQVRMQQAFEARNKDGGN